MRASTRLIAPTHLDKSNRYKILSSPQTHNSGYIKRRLKHQRRAATVSACEKNMRTKLGRDPTEAELPSILAMTIEKLRSIRAANLPLDRGAKAALDVGKILAAC